MWYNRIAKFKKFEYNRSNDYGSFYRWWKNIKDGFSELRKIKDELNKEYFNNNLTELSMGMSNDYKIALQEGSTFIRVGTKIFK